MSKLRDRYAEYKSHRCSGAPRLDLGDAIIEDALNAIDKLARPMSKPFVPLSCVVQKMKVVAKTINLQQRDILTLLRHAGHDVPDSATVEVADDDLDVSTSTLLRISFEIRENES